MKLAVVSVCAATFVALSGAGQASGTVTLRGYGTAAIDGVLSGEWDGAARYDFQANRSPAEGGGTVPATLYAMNDATNLYLALRVAVTDIGYGSFDMEFLAPGQNPFAPGSDILRAQSFAFEDYHYHESSPNSWTWLADVDDGGTHDGTAAVAQQLDGSWVYEVSHPLNTSDDRHDFSLTIPEHVRFFGTFWQCLVGPGCTTTHMPAEGFGDLVVVSGSRIPPDTTITAGPAEGAQTSDYGDWEFSGSDEATPVADLTYECKVDEGEWSSCETPYGPATTVDGWHTLSVRALDDMLNADPTPAQRRWRIDTTGPSKPKVARLGRTLRFSAKDSGTPSSQLRFRCAIDAKRLHACGKSVRVRFPGRRHVVRVRAVDPAGNESTVRIVRLAAKRHSG